MRISDRRASNRVLMLVENNPYPADFRVRREAMALHVHGFEVTVIAPRGEAEAWFEVIGGITVRRFPRPPAGTGLVGYALEFGWATFAMLCLALWVILRKGVDVVHAANPPDTLFIIGGVARLFGARFIFDHHDLSPEIYRSRGEQRPSGVAMRILASLERWTFAVADVVIATNESYKSIAMTRGRKAADKVFVVRNGPPLSYVPLEADAGLRARAPYLIGYVGTIGPQDGLDHWVRAVHALVNELKRSDFLAVVVGDGDALPGVRLLVEDLELGRFLHFTGRLDESATRRVLSSVDVCVQPDPSSPLNDRSTMNKLMEYMALGKPTVAFDLPETRHSAAGAASYVVPNDDLAFARAVSFLLDHPDERVRMGESGRIRVRDHLAWEHSVLPLLAAYREALKRPHTTTGTPAPVDAGPAEPALDPRPSSTKS